MNVDVGHSFSFNACMQRAWFIDEDIEFERPIMRVTYTRGAGFCKATKNERLDLIKLLIYVCG